MVGEWQKKLWVLFSKTYRDQRLQGGWQSNQLWNSKWMARMGRLVRMLQFLWQGVENQGSGLQRKSKILSRRICRDQRVLCNCVSRLFPLHSSLFLLYIISGSVKPSEWQEWNEWSKCSSSCGKGLKIRARACSGRQGSCQGEPTETKDCFMVECPGFNSSVFRALQFWIQIPFWTKPAHSCDVA